MASPTATTEKIKHAQELRGLTSHEVHLRTEAGWVNTSPTTVGDSTLTIIRRNAVSLVNILLFAISGGLIALGLYRDAVLTAGIIIINIGIGIFQELRAKRKLEQIALLNRPTATAIRDGTQQEIDPNEIVTGDLLIIQAGDQIPVDAVLKTDGEMQIDEANLTGESDLVRKRLGEELLSGSYCIAGGGVCEVIRVGDESSAQRITSEARSYRNIKTPLQRDIDTIIRAMTVAVAILAALVIFQFDQDYGEVPIIQTAQASAVLVALVPQGLILMVVVAYSLAIMRLAPQGALIQRINAVESLSHIDVLCVDKTGTLTTQNLQVDELVPYDIELDDLRARLGDFVASSPSGNRTSDAIGAECKGKKRAIHEEVPFASIRKWSALSFEGEDGGAYVLGAPEMLVDAVGDVPPELSRQLNEWTRQGLRVLLFAHDPELDQLYGVDGEPQLPPGLRVIGLISIRDELRPGVQETIQSFNDIGIGLKVISGDNPETVLALAKQAGLPETSTAISGAELNRLDEEQLEEVAVSNAVFGRVTPEHKESLVRALERRGHWVAMTGDGVNDILALKEAKVGIAMRSGSEATRSAADMVLMNDSFDVLPPAFAEGQRVMRGMTDNIKLFLTRTLSIVFLIYFTTMLGREFPLTPSQNSILATLTVGIPAFALAIWAKPGHTPRNLWRLVVQFVLPAALMVSIISIAVYDNFMTLTDENVAWSQAAVTTTMVSTLLLIVLFAQPPSPMWVGASGLNGDRRPLYLVIVMYLAYFAIVMIPFTREFFDLQTLPQGGYVMLAFIVTGWAVIVRYLWRMALGERIWQAGEDGVARLVRRLDVDEEEEAEA